MKSLLVPALKTVQAYMSPNQLGENFFSFLVVHVRWNNRIGYIILTEMSKKLELNDTI